MVLLGVQRRPKIGVAGQLPELWPREMQRVPPRRTQHEEMIDGTTHIALALLALDTSFSGPKNANLHHGCQHQKP